jgi:hypothetical protein
MAVAVEMSYPGGTIEQYEKAVDVMGLTPGAKRLLHQVLRDHHGATPPHQVSLSLRSCPGRSSRETRPSARAQDDCVGAAPART